MAGYEVRRHAVAKWKIVSDQPNGSFSNKESAFDVITRIYYRVYWAAQTIEEERADSFLMPTKWVIHALEQRPKRNHIVEHEDESICDSPRK